MATIQQNVLRGESRMVLSGISWQLYERLREDTDNRHVHMAYDQGTLELMSPRPNRLDSQVSRLGVSRSYGSR